MITDAKKIHAEILEMRPNQVMTIYTRHNGPIHIHRVRTCEHPSANFMVTMGPLRYFGSRIKVKDPSTIQIGWAVELNVEGILTYEVTKEESG